MEYDFFDGTATKAKSGKPIKKYESIVLRNGGNDNNSAFFRDSINQILVADRAFTAQAMSECVVFIDGEYWGIYQITEKLGDSTLASHYGVEKSDVAIIKNFELEEGETSDLNDWEALMTGVSNGSISYKQLCEKVDKQSFLDYFAAQVYWANNDWPQNNMAVWRCNTIDETNPYADGKWRMLLFDTESSTGLYNMQNSVQTDSFSRIKQVNDNDFCKMFAALLNDKDFCKDYSATMMDLANYNFAPERTTPPTGPS